MTIAEVALLVGGVALLCVGILAGGILLGALAGLPVRRRRSRERGFFDKVR